jgi:hypothetical protein
VWGVLFALNAHSGEGTNEISNRTGSIYIIGFGRGTNDGVYAASQPTAVHSLRKPW